MTEETFDQSCPDSQATPVKPMAVEAFDFDAYIAYEQSLSRRCREFWQARSGVLVYRRMRVAEVFSWACRDMKASLQCQLGALSKSMDYRADVPNFLEPWYGIGTIASLFGARYIWHPNQAPAMTAPSRRPSPGRTTSRSTARRARTGGTASSRHPGPPRRPAAAHRDASPGARWGARR